jgi:hypothetical protein
MAGELLTQVDFLEKRVERLERLLSKLDPNETGPAQISDHGFVRKS